MKKYIFVFYASLALNVCVSQNSFPLLSSGDYSGTQNGDYTSIINPQLKLASPIGYPRVVHLSANPDVAAVYNFQTGKNVYWGEGGDIGSYYFRGRNLIVQQGSVGIGTSTPYQWSKLHMKAIGTYPWSLLVEASSNDKIIGMSHNGTSGVIATSYLGNGGHSPLQFVTSDVTRMWIDASGNIGIGTTSPSARLDVASTGTGGSTLIYGGVLGSKNNGHELNLVGGTPVDGAWTSQLGGHIRLGGSARGDNNKNAIQFIQNGVERMRVNDGGYVGIGTVTPDALLTVKGTVHSNEVKVDLSVPGPDYVFEKSYTLPTLEEVKSYIDQNKHLPEVPSAKEMEANGVNVGEMNMLLLKKIEELTLHMIEMKKENDGMRTKMEQLEKQMKKLN